MNYYKLADFDILQIVPSRRSLISLLDVAAGPWPGSMWSAAMRSRLRFGCPTSWEPASVPPQVTQSLNVNILQI